MSRTWGAWQFCRGVRPPAPDNGSLPDDWNYGNYGKLWGIMGNYGELWGIMEELWRIMGNYGGVWVELWGIMGELWGIMGNYGELWWNYGLVLILDVLLFVPDGLLLILAGLL